VVREKVEEALAIAEALFETTSFSRAKRIKDLLREALGD
jgi:Zn-dependent M16 (insulinase) family peptidase